MPQQSLPQLNQIITSEGNQQIFKILGNFAYNDNELVMNLNAGTFSFKGNVVWNGILYRVTGTPITLSNVENGYVYLYFLNGNVVLGNGIAENPVNKDWAVLGQVNTGVFTRKIETIDYNIINLIKNNTKLNTVDGKIPTVEYIDNVIVIKYSDGTIEMHGKYTFTNTMTKALGSAFTTLSPITIYFPYTIKYESDSTRFPIIQLTTSSPVHLASFNGFLGYSLPVVPVRYIFNRCEIIPISFVSNSTTNTKIIYYSVYGNING